MNRDTKKGLKMVGSVNPLIVQVQLVDYYPNKKIIIKIIEIIEK